MNPHTTPDTDTTEADPRDRYLRSLKDAIFAALHGATDDTAADRMMLTGRRARRARARGYGLEKPTRSRCTRKRRRRRTGGVK